MKKIVILFILLIGQIGLNAQNNEIDHAKVREDLAEILHDISAYYSYLPDKKIDLNCIRENYTKQITQLKTPDDVVLFFEYLLDEFWDSHLILNTNRSSSFRLYAPIYLSIQNDKPIITSVWQSQLATIAHPILGAEVLKINGMKFSKAVQAFPTHCQNKQLPEVKEWVGNKLLAGRYNQPRIITLKLLSGKIIEFDLDAIQVLKTEGLLTSKIQDNIGIIRINNSLGNNALIEQFDQTLSTLMNTDGLILDLRNTVDGGNSYVARGIMSRFIHEPKAYQRHVTSEQYDDGPAIERNWVEYVSPRLQQYKKPVVILIGRWTGSMGEGLAIGMDGMNRAKLVGTEMERLAGGMAGFSFKHQRFGYRLSVERLYHVDGTPREKYVPTHYVAQKTLKKDEILERGLQLLKKK
ncbi:MAG: S41 family peptidase [Flammeovirgaceae bacterium]